MRLVTVLACAAFFKDRTGLAVLPCIPPMSAYYEALIVYKDPTAMHLRQHIRVDVFYLFLQMCIVELRRVNGEEEVQARPFLAPLLIAQCESILWYQPETVKGRADCQLLQIQAYLMVLFPQLIAEAEERQRLTLIYVQTLCSMAARYHHRTLLRDIVTALGLLCHDNPEAQAVFRSAGGIVYVVEILRRMTNWSKPRIDPYVDCLWSATQNNSESSSVMRQCGGIFLLCDWIERSDAEVQTRIIRCLADLAEDRRNQEHMFAWRSKTDAGVGLCELLLTLAVREKMHLSSENRRWGGANSEGVYNLVLTILCFLENIKDKKFMYNMSQQENIAYLFSDGLNGRFATGFPALLQSCLTQNIVPTEYDAQFLVEMGQMYVDHHERVTSCLNQMAEKRTADALEGEATLKEVFRATFG
ncbi:hypothetical protein CAUPRSCDRAFT_12020 [Caulochytrium protostelioides]|nr:hypothetical protein CAUPRSCDRAFT_12020 [Caulochytrium protostelioides]